MFLITDQITHAQRTVFGSQESTAFFKLKLQGHFSQGGIFRAERHFLLFKDQLGEVDVNRRKKISFLAENSAYWKTALMC